jgi:hypothetical protein
LLVLFLMPPFLGVVPAHSQQGKQLSAADSTALGAPTTVHGVVKNAATGEPLPRALVLIDGDGGIGTLTDGDGRFEIPSVTLGPNTFQITKPGFDDAPGGPAGAPLRDLRGYTHNVFVIPSTPELVFSMRPSNSIRGRIDLSTGDPANNAISLLRREIVNGHAVWRPHANARTNADGSYHFAHLQDGDYVVVAEPSPDSDLVASPALVNPDRDVASSWYPQMYYPDARDFTGAAHIHLAGGEQAQANFSLPLEPFHTIRATLQLPGDFSAPGAVAGVSLEIAGPDGHHLPYPGVSNQKDNSVQAILPDGNYSFRVNANRTEIGATAFSHNFRGGPIRRIPSLAGELDFTVAGHALTKLRIPVGPQTPTPLQVDVNRSGTQSASPAIGRGETFVEISQAGPLTDGMNSVFAQGAGPGTLDTLTAAPGLYWLHAIVAQAGFCESSFTAGGANLGREPLVVGLGGITAPLTLTLRDDCASLKLNLPPAAAGMTAGEEPSYTVYLVPDFDFTVEASNATLRASTGGAVTFSNLTPGSYHVYTFSAPVELEYHNREALAAFPSQAITLAPGNTQNLTLEVPAQ